MCEISIPLEGIPSEQLSFTYPDSFTAMGFSSQFGLPYVPRQYHKKVFRIEQLAQVVKEYGIPVDDVEEGHQNYHLKPFEKYIEVQLWSNKPIAHILEAAL
jgi:hypothetical protein